MRRVYEVLHGCVAADMVLAMDTPFFAPPEQPEASSNRSWPHVDHNEQDFLTGDWDVWQGLLFAWPSDMSHASTTVKWPRSHLTVCPGTSRRCPRRTTPSRHHRHHRHLWPFRLKPFWLKVSRGNEHN